jgi:hypothetical protein
VLVIAASRALTTGSTIVLVPKQIRRASRGFGEEEVPGRAWVEARFCSPAGIRPVTSWLVVSGGSDVVGASLVVAFRDEEPPLGRALRGPVSGGAVVSDQAAGPPSRLGLLVQSEADGRVVGTSCR